MDHDASWTRRLRSQADALSWYHTIDLGQGVVTKGVDDTPLRLARIDFPRSLAGRTVLDIVPGMASSRSRPSAGVPRAWWRPIIIRGMAADWARKPGSSSARTTLGSRVEDVNVDVMELSPERVGTFDVVLFLGVLYHHATTRCWRWNGWRRSPANLLILENGRRHGRHQPAGDGLLPRDRDLNRDPTNWWGPNVPAVHALLRSVGFTRSRTVTPLPSAPYRAARAVAHLVAWPEWLRAGIFGRTVPRSTPGKPHERLRAHCKNRCRAGLSGLPDAAGP
jgi:tRNA (mo5U34)-methyltransferase